MSAIAAAAKAARDMSAITGAAAMRAAACYLSGFYASADFDVPSAADLVAPLAITAELLPTMEQSFLQSL